MSLRDPMAEMQERERKRRKRQRDLPGVAAAYRIDTVIVGPSHVKFQIHSNLLTHHSEYFRKALSGPWKEAAERIVTFADLEANTFAVFVDWLYTKNMPNSPTKWQDLETFEMPDFSLYGRTELLSCIKSYALGDRLLATGFCRAVNDCFDEILQRRFAYLINCDALIQPAFSMLAQGCVILQNLVDIYCVQWDDNRMNYSLKVRNRLPLEFHRRTANKLHELSKMTAEGRRQKRCYKEHTNDVEKAACPALHFRWNAEKELGIFE